MRSTSFIEELRKKKQDLSPREDGKGDPIIARKIDTLSENKDTGYSAFESKNTFPFDKKKFPMTKEDSNLILDDIDSEDIHQLIVPPKDDIDDIIPEPVTIETAVELRKILFRSTSRSFNAEWIKQGFHFSVHPLLLYGLIQDKGGPCGLLAAVQAYVLKFLLVDDRNRLKGVGKSKFLSF